MNKERSFSIEQINTLSGSEFVEVFGSVIEHTAWAADIAGKSRPFKTVDDLQTALIGAVDAEGKDAWMDVLNKHPELSGKEAKEGTLTASSQSEQGRLGLDRLSKGNFELMSNFNKSYREKFGFPFIVCVSRLQSLEELFAEQRKRFDFSIDEEFANAQKQVAAIVRIRLEKLIQE